MLQSIALSSLIPGLTHGRPFLCNLGAMWHGIVGNFLSHLTILASFCPSLHTFPIRDNLFGQGVLLALYTLWAGGRRSRLASNGSCPTQLGCRRCTRPPPLPLRRNGKKDNRKRELRHESHDRPHSCRCTRRQVKERESKRSKPSHRFHACRYFTRTIITDRNCCNCPCGATIAGCGFSGKERRVREKPEIGSRMYPMKCEMVNDSSNGLQLSLMT